MSRTLESVARLALLVIGLGVAAAAMLRTHVVASEDPTVFELLPVPERIAMNEARSWFPDETNELLVVLCGSEWTDERVVGVVRELNDALDPSGAEPYDFVDIGDVTPPLLGARLLYFDPTPSARHGDADVEATIATVERVVAARASEDEPIFVLGMPRVRAESVALATEDLRAQSPFLALILLLVPAIFLRSAVAGALALLVASMTTGLTLAGYQLFVGPVTITVLLVVPILWAVATMDALHLVSRMRLHRRRGQSPVWAASLARDELLAPCLVTTLTTALGFATIGFVARAGVLVSLGWSAAAGTLIAYALTFVLGPWLLRSAEPIERRFARVLDRRSRVVRANVASRVGLVVVRAARRAPRTTLVVWALATLAAAAALPRLRVDTSTTNAFARGTALRADLDAFETRFDVDPVPLDLIVHPGRETDRVEQRPSLQTTLSALAVLTTELRALDSVRVVLPIDAVEDFGDVVTASRRFGFGNVEAELRDLQELAFVDDWMQVDDRRVRMRVLLRPGATFDEKRAVLERIAELDRAMLSQFSVSCVGVGYAAVRAEMLGVENLRAGGAVSLLVLVIALAVGMRRSPIAFFVSVLPLVLTAGLMGWTGIPWSIALAALPGVLLGLAVDDSVHLLWGTRRRVSLRSLDAILGTTVLVASVALVLSFSRLQPNHDFGVLLVFGLVVAMLADLTLLPALARVRRR